MMARPAPAPVPPAPAVLTGHNAAPSGVPPLSTGTGTASTPSTASRNGSNAVAVQPAAATAWSTTRRIIASNITAFVLTILGLITGTVFFVLGYTPTLAGLKLSSQSYKISMWKDCRDRPVRMFASYSITELILHSRICMVQRSVSHTWK
jgi:hypothetical protein